MPTSKLIDIGTGAGIPGIPLKIILPELSVTLLDSNKKKCSFLEEVIKELDLKKIANARKPLYRRWYGELTDEEVMEIVIRQGAEYATMGSIALSELKNPLILGVDHAKMAPFYSFKGQIPTLYLTSSYLKDS